MARNRAASAAVSRPRPAATDFELIAQDDPMKRSLPRFSIAMICIGLLCRTTIFAAATQPVHVTIDPSDVRQEFQGLGCGVQWYEAHVTSLAARHKDQRQRQLYDDMFAKVPTRYLNLMIRPDHQPQDNVDPWNPVFDP